MPNIKEILIKYMGQTGNYHIRPLPGGCMNSVYAVSNGDNIEYVVRINKSLNGSFAQHIENDSYLDKLYPELLDLKPKCIVSQRASRNNTFGFSVNTYVQGASIDTTLDFSIFEHAGNCLAKVHSFIAPGEIGPIANARSLEDCTAENYYFSYFNSIVQLLFRHDKELAKQIDRYNNQHFHISEYDNQSIVLLHGDIHLKNILVSSNKKIYLIDWDCSKYGYAEQDFIKLANFKFPHGSLSQQRLLLRAFINGYKHIRALEFTNNFDIHVINWMAKMLAFETENHCTDNGYFWGPSYFYEKIKLILLGKYSYREMLENA